MTNVVVTNKNAEAYARKFDGDLYKFPPNEAVVVPEVAAAYLFGYGGTDADRQRIVIRNGWQKNGIVGDPQGPEAAMDRLKNFVFKKDSTPEAKQKKPEKSVAPAQGRQMTGINAVSPNAKDNGRTILPSGVRLPGQVAPMAPPVANV